MWVVSLCCRSEIRGVFGANAGQVLMHETRNEHRLRIFTFASFACTLQLSTASVIGNSKTGKGRELIFYGEIIPIGKTFDIRLACVKLPFTMINRIRTLREKETVSAQTHICFQSQWKVGSRFEISILCVIKRLLSLFPHHCATCLQTRLLNLRI